MSSKRTTLSAQIRAMPDASHRILSDRRPRTSDVNATPTSRKPTTPLTPEQDDATDSTKGLPACATVKSEPSDPEAGVATCQCVSDAVRALMVKPVKPSSQRLRNAV